LEIIDAGHYGIEHIFIKFISEYLEKKLLSSQIVQMDKKIPFVIVWEYY